MAHFDQRLLHQQAFDVAFELLEHLATKPTAILVAVLWHDIPMPVTDVRRESFMFVKCTARTTVGKIKEAYLAREEAPSDVSLRLGSVVPSGTVKVGNLDHFNDKVIVFHARSVDPLDTTTNTIDGSTSSTSNNTSSTTKNATDNTSNGANSAHSSLSSLSSLPSPSTPQFAAHSMGNGISGPSPSGAPASVRHPSISSRTSANPFRPYSAPSARMSSSSSKPGYATSPRSPLVKTDPVPSTPGPTSSRGNPTLSSTQHHIPAYHTPTRYAQAAGSPFVKHEPIPVPTHPYVPYTPAPQARYVQPPRAAPRPQGLSYGPLHNPAHHSQPNGIGHVQPASDAASTHPVSLFFMFPLLKWRVLIMS
jgi:hypothetical protein